MKRSEKCRRCRKSGFTERLRDAVQPSFCPHTPTEPTLGTLLEPLFGQFQREDSRRSLPRTPVNKHRCAHVYHGGALATRGTLVPMTRTKKG
jgi:hypothetical protein